MLRSRGLPPQTLLTDVSTDQTALPRLCLGHRDDPVLVRPTGDLKYKLGPDRLFELVAILDRNHERTRPSDHAILVIDIEVVDIRRRIGWFLHHDRQAVDDNALLQRRVARPGDGGTIIVGAIAGNIDHAS